MIKLSGFGDEIAPDLEAQLAVLASEGIHHLELRAVWGKGVLELSDAEVARVKEVLAANDFRVSAIASPIGKVEIRKPFGPQLDLLQRAIRVAKTLDTLYVRVFSFYMPEEGPPERYREEVLQRLEAMVKLARDEGIVLLHENEKDIYGDTAKHCFEILSAIDSAHLRAVFDFANFVEIGERPSMAFLLLQPYVAYFHVKDAKLRIQGSIVLPGQGDGEIPRIMKKAISGGFNGFVSLEPHLHLSGRFSGFSGPEGFRAAARALKGILEKEGIQWA